MTIYSIEPSLIVQCLSNECATVQSTIALSRTSKICQSIINSPQFFNCFIRSEKLTSDTFTNIQQLIENSTSFKARYFQLRAYFDSTHESGPGIGRGIVLANDQEVEFIRECPEDRKESNLYQKYSHAANSKDFLAFIRKNDSDIHVYTADGRRAHLATYTPNASIIQLAIEGSSLYAIEKFDSQMGMMTTPCQLLVYNLDAPKQTQPLHTLLLGNFTKGHPSCRPICIGKEYLIYWDALYSRICAISKFSFNASDSIHVQLPSDFLTHFHIFAHGNDFILLARRTESGCAAFTISKIKIQDKTLNITQIATDVVLYKNSRSALHDICFSMDRLFFAYESVSEISLYSYDLITSKLAHLLTTRESPTELSFEPRFLTAATNIWFLIMTIPGLGLNPPGEPLCTQSSLRKWKYVI